MSFMQPETYFGEVQRINNTREGDIVTPRGYEQYDDATAAEEYNVEPEDVVTESGWYARLSAPGYLDCTEWSGPFDTEEEAIEELKEMHGDDIEDLD